MCMFERNVPSQWDPGFSLIKVYTQNIRKLKSILILWWNILFNAFNFHFVAQSWVFQCVIYYWDKKHSTKSTRYSSSLQSHKVLYKKVQILEVLKLENSRQSSLSLSSQCEVAHAIYKYVRKNQSAFRTDKIACRERENFATDESKWIINQAIIQNLKIHKKLNHSLYIDFTSQENNVTYCFSKTSPTLKIAQSCTRNQDSLTVYSWQ